MKNIEVYTDGSCKGNPGPGGWAATFLFEGEKKPFAVIFGNTANTTNNRMEMTAVIEALRFLKAREHQESKIMLYSDSNLVVQTINAGWKRKKNTDLWKQFDNLNKGLKIQYVWVKGHAENHWNEQTDRVALKEAEKAAKKVIKQQQENSHVEGDPLQEDQGTLF